MENASNTNMAMFLEGWCMSSLNDQYVQMINAKGIILVSMERAQVAIHGRLFVCGRWATFQGDVMILLPNVWCYKVWAGKYCAPMIFLAWIPFNSCDPYNLP